MFTFTDLIHAARCFVIDQIVKAAGHKYIKRIPISSNPTKYRYIYSATSTVGGKNILDEAHLKVGTKLMLQSEAGAQVHAHVEKVSGDKVTVVYDDGDKKGQSRTFTKQQLLNQFNEEHGISDQLTAAKDKLLADIQSAVAGGRISEKQLARLVERLESLDPAGKGAGQKKPKEFTSKERSAMNLAKERYIINPFREFTDEELAAVAEKVEAARAENLTVEEGLKINQSDNAIYKERNRRMEERRKAEREAEERARLGSKLKRDLESDSTKNARAKADEDGDSPVSLQNYNSTDAREIAEAKAAEQPYQALRVMDIVLHEEKHAPKLEAARAEVKKQKDAPYATRRIKQRFVDAAKRELDDAYRAASTHTGGQEEKGYLLAELVHNEAPTTTRSLTTAREREIMDAVGLFEYSDTTTKAGKRTADAKKSQAAMLSKLEQHIEEHYPQDDATPFKDVRAKTRAALQEQIEKIKAHSKPSDDHKAVRLEAVKRIKGIARGEHINE